MTDIKLTINLSEQALMDLLDGLEVGVKNINPQYYRYRDVDRLYDRILDASNSDKKKIDFLYKREIKK